MSNAVKWAIGAVAVIVIAGGAYAIFHKSPTPSTNNTNTSSNTSTNTNPVILTKTSSSLGQYLTDPNGRALYTYNADTSGKSNCTGSCLTAWPAYTATSSMANLPSGITTLTRSDTSQVQYVYNGKPLYYFASDTGTQVTGNGVQNFSVAKPSSAAAQPSSSTSAQPASSSSSSGYPY